MFVSLEGPDGVGKTTQAALLAERLRAAGLEVVQCREPGGTELGERVRDLLLDRAMTMGDRSEALLFAAARAEIVERVIGPALARGAWVVCDRFTDATRAYQGGGRGVDRAFIESMARVIHRDTEPDLTLLLDLPVATGLERARRRRLAAGETVADRFESESLEFFARVRARYLEIAAAEPQRVRLLDATQSAAQVAAAAVAALETLTAGDGSGSK